MKRGPKTGVRRTPERIFIEMLKVGGIFYSTKQDKDLTAIASNCNKKILTERLICIHPITLKTERITRVAITE